MNAEHYAFGPGRERRAIDGRVELAQEDLARQRRQWTAAGRRRLMISELGRLTYFASNSVHASFSRTQVLAELGRRTYFGAFWA